MQIVHSCTEEECNTKQNGSSTMEPPQAPHIVTDNAGEGQSPSSSHSSSVTCSDDVQVESASHLNLAKRQKIETETSTTEDLGTFETTKDSPSSSGREVVVKVQEQKNNEEGEETFNCSKDPGSCSSPRLTGECIAKNNDEDSEDFSLDSITAQVIYQYLEYYRGGQSFALTKHAKTFFRYVL